MQTQDETKINGLEEISNFIFTSKYARYSDKNRRRETWDEAVSRVEGMHLEKYSFLPDEDKEAVYELLSGYYEKFEETPPEYNDSDDDNDADDNRGASDEDDEDSEDEQEKQFLTALIRAFT